MPDPYASIDSVDVELQARLAAVLELRAAEPQQRAMLDTYLADLELPQAATALDVGCGTGAVTRVLTQLPDVGNVTGIDLSPVFVEKARELGQGFRGLSFQIGDARALPFHDASFDLVVFHTVLCHVPEPDQALREARRVLRPGGWLAIFDGDYPTTSVAIDTFDPLQSTVATMIANFVHNPWLTRRLKRILESMGFDIVQLRSHGYVQTTEPTYMLTIIDRGADLLVGNGGIGAAQADALKHEARRRVRTGEFFGYISFLSVVARALAARG
jgi:ubiquinone/menaquinone biosynthesis C-methylase UbiE